MDLIKDGLPRAAVRLPGQVSMRRRVASTTRTTSDRRCVFIVGFGQQGSTRCSIGAAQLGLDRFPQVLQEMESVSDLPRMGRSLARAPRIQAAAIAADDFDLRMLPKPFGCPGGCTILQNIDDLAPLEVNDYGSVSATLSPAPIVDACHPYRRLRAETRDLPLQMPQNGVVAGRHAKTLHQSFSRSAPRSVSEKMNKFSDSLGSTSVRTDNFRQLIRKCLTLALPVQTSPTAHLHLHQHGDALHGEILKMTEVSAVPTCRRRAASGTGAHFRSCGRDHPTITVPLDPKNPHTRPGSPIYIFLHAPLIREGADQTKQHGK
jgi:hypothetical protein